MARDPERKKANAKRYYERHKAKVKASNYAYRAKNPEKWKEATRLYQQKRYAADPDYWRGRSIKKRYGITLDEFTRLLEAQGHACAICRTPADRIRKCVDHCHQTGKVRGILCQGCNVGIAQLQDDPLVVLRAAEYLQRHK